MTSSRNTADTDALLKTILQESTAEILIFDADSLRIIQANPAAVHNLQHPLNAIQNSPRWIAWPKKTYPSCPACWLRCKAGKSAGPHSMPPAAAVTARCIRQKSNCPARLAKAKPVFIWVATDISPHEATPPTPDHPSTDLRAIVAHIPGMAYQALRKPDGRTALCYVSEQSAQLLGDQGRRPDCRPGTLFRSDHGRRQGRLPEPNRPRRAAGT